MARRNEINMRNVTYGNNQTTNIHYGNEQGDQRRNVFLDAVQRQDIIKIKQYFIAHPDIFDNEFKVNTFMFACEHNKMSAKNILWQNWKNELLPLLLHKFEQCQDNLSSTKDIMKTSDAVQRYILLNYITRGNEEMFRKAVMSGANPYLPAEDGQLLINKARSRGFRNLGEYKNLCEAVRDRNIIMTQAMLLRGHDIEERNEYNNRPLHVAMNRGNIETITLLLDHRADVNRRNNDGNTPLHQAARWGDRELVQVLLRAGAHLNTLNGQKYTALDLAILEGHIEAAELLVEHGASLDNIADIDNRFLGAVMCGSLQLITDLVRAGANVNAVNGRKMAALHLATLAGRDEAAKKLVQYGADVNCTDVDDNTPLHLAIQKNNIQTAQLLIQEHADVNCQDKYGVTPLQYAAVCDSPDLVHILLQARADVKCKDNHDNTPLHEAARSGRVETIQVLLKAGAIVNTVNDDNMTPLDFAIRGEKEAIIKLLKDHGAVEGDQIWRCSIQ